MVDIEKVFGLTEDDWWEITDWVTKRLNAKEW